MGSLETYPIGWNEMEMSLSTLQGEEKFRIKIRNLDSYALPPFFIYDYLHKIERWWYHWFIKHRKQFEIWYIFIWSMNVTISDTAFSLITYLWHYYLLRLSTSPSCSQVLMGWPMRIPTMSWIHGSRSTHNGRSLRIQVWYLRSRIPMNIHHGYPY